MTLYLFIDAFFFSHLQEPIESLQEILQSYEAHPYEYDYQKYSSWIATNEQWLSC